METDAEVFTPLYHDRIAASSAARAEDRAGKFDFDTPLDRLGTGSIRWDAPVSDYEMPRIIAGMGVADMDFTCAPVITQALQKRIAFPSWGYEQMDANLVLNNMADTSFVQGILDWNRRRYGVTNIDPQMVGVTPGVIPGIINALQAFAPKGSKVLMLTPSYIGFYLALNFTKLVAVESPLKKVDGRYEIDWADLERQMTPDVKVSILCNPHNPTGRCWTRDELTRYGELCRKHNIIVLADEIHCDFISKGQHYVPFSSLDPAIVDNSITFKSASKSFSLAAMKCGWFFTTNRTLFEGTNRSAFPAITQLALLAQQAAYAGGEEWLSACVDYVDANLDYASDYLRRKIPLVKGYKPEATYLMWLNITEVAEKIGARKIADEANARRPLPTNPINGGPLLTTVGDVVSEWIAKNAYVALESGSGFGEVGANFIRMNVATSRVTLNAALGSMAAALDRLG